MQVGDAKPQNMDRMGSYVDWDDPTLTGWGLARLAQNCRYIERSVATRYANQRNLSTNEANAFITGLQCLNFLSNSAADKNTVLAYSSKGTLWREAVEGAGGNLTQINPTLVQLPVGAYAQMSQGFNRMSIAFGDPLKGLARPVVVDNSNNLDPISYPLTGQAWEATRYYNAGTMVAPTPANGHLYRAQNAGTSGGGQPAFPLTDSATVVDNAGPTQITWKEMTPNAGTVLPPPLFGNANGFTFATIAGAGAFAAGRDVYLIATYSNGSGQTLPSQVILAINNTVLNDRLQITVQPFPSWLTGLAGAFVPTVLTIYEADVAHGAAAPAVATFKGVANAAPAGTINVDTTGGGAGPPGTNTAIISPAGNICAGNRNLTLLFKNRNAYTNGMTAAAIIGFNVQAAGFQLWVGNIAVGPGNCVERVLAFTVAGDPAAGPFFYIGQNDSDSADLGTTIVSTRILDNVTTGAYMQFTDSYLPASGIDVTGFFQKLEIPACADVFFARSLARNIYSGSDFAGPSGFLVSDATDPETVNSQTGVVKIANEDGSRAMCWREMNGVQYALKGKSGSVLHPSTDNPNKWNGIEQWHGSGPCSPRAVDVVDLENDHKMVYWDDTRGPYLFTGSMPEPLGIEMTRVIKRVTRSAVKLIWVAIDNERQEVHFGLPLDGSVSINKELVMNFAEGWNIGYTFMPRTGRYVPIPGRKWSLNDLAATTGKVITRNLVAAPDPTIATSQLVFASGNPAGKGDIWMQVPNVYSDKFDGATKIAIDCQYKTGFAPGARSPSIMALVGVELQGKGIGKGKITVIGSKQVDAAHGVPDGTYTFADWLFQDAAAPPVLEAVYEDAAQDAENFNFSLEITNGNKVDAMFELHHATIWLQPRWRSAA